MMNNPMNLPFFPPRGAQTYIVDNDHPDLSRRPLAIQGSPSEILRIVQIFYDYRTWYTLEQAGTHPESMPIDGSGGLEIAIRDLYQYNESDPGFAHGVDSVTIFYTKGAKERVRKQLATFPERLPRLDDKSLGRVSKSIHISTSSGTTSLAVLEQCLDISAPEIGVHLCLNNPIDPSFAAYVPREGAMPLAAQAPVLKQQEYTERAAWELAYKFLSASGHRVAEDRQHPNGANEFPDYAALIDGEETLVEITSVPDMRKWTISASNRRLEETIARVAREKDETLEEVEDALLRVIGRKRARALKHQANIGKSRKPRYSLILSNHSTYNLLGNPLWSTEDLSVFHHILLIQFVDQVHQIQ